MMNRSLDPNTFPAHPEHGKVISATRSWGCANGHEFWETWLKYEDNFVEATDYTPGDQYD